MKYFLRTICALFLGLYLSLFLFYPATESAPKLANYFLYHQITDAQARELAKWDLLILDMEVQANSPTQLDLIKKINPDIILLAYITSEEIRDDAGTQSWTPLRRKLSQGIDHSWFILDHAGAKISIWPGTTMLNVSSLCPTVNGVKFNQYLAQFVAGEILSSGKWNGVFYDNGWEKLSWFTTSADLDRDGQAETNPDSHWQEGMKELFDTTRRISGGKYLVVTNGTSRVFRDNVNGIMSETFPAAGGWKNVMEVYRFQEQGVNNTPRVIVINSNTNNTGSQNNYRAMRFGLLSALLGNAFYSFDHGDQDHGQTWWYDEYDVNLGEPSGPARSLTGQSYFSEGVWRRDYSHGIALVNSSATEQAVDLDGEFEKIRGTQDKTVNNGFIVDRVKLPARDGLVLLKTFRAVDNIFFINGSFARFYDFFGKRARNGFFVFEDGQSGGANIFRGDIKGNNLMEKIVVSGPRLTIFDDTGGIWYNDYPLDPNLSANLSVATGHLSNNTSFDILLSAPRGGRVALYNYHGSLIKNNFYPFGKKNIGPIALAIGDVDADGRGEAILGVGAGAPAEILVYDSALTKIKSRFFPFGNKYQDGLKIAVGDINGDDKIEIVAVQTKIAKPIVRIFDQKGKKLREFAVDGALGGVVEQLGAVDINFDGNDEVVVMTK
ncbi:MAG: putative glycoside hydrolase [Candidatus Magasanikbacteria bacterium]